MLSINIVIWSLAIFTFFSFALYIVHAQATAERIPVPALLQQHLPGSEPKKCRSFGIEQPSDIHYRVSTALVHAPASSLCQKNRVRR